MRLLIVEDNLDLSKALKTILERQRYTVDLVDNGIDAIHYAKSNNYDGMILDVMLPGLDGFSVIKELRDIHINIPTILLTARTTITDKVKGLDAGADDYLTKPFETAELLARVRAMLRRKQALHTDQLTFGDLTLDNQTFELKYKNNTVRLSKKNYLSMEMLMENADRIVSTQRFIEHIWGWNSDIDANVIWVYISNLRQTLSKLKAPYEIKAVRGVGYILGELHD